jgi:hypothetical protein
LPNGILNRPKSGFGIPVGPWYRDLIGHETPKPPDRLWSRTWARQIFAMTRESPNPPVVEPLAARAM